MAAQFGVDFEQQQLLIKSLISNDCYDHEVDDISLIETHISWVILTGKYAYKIKKSLNLGFLDYSSLALRQHFCQQELLINRRTAAQVYLDNVALYGSAAQPSFKPIGPVIEYAVKMLQFPQQALLSYLADQGQIDSKLIEQLAITLAEFHQRIERLTADSPLGEPDIIWQPIEENFTQILERFDDPDLGDTLKPLKSWALNQYHHLKSEMQQRKQHGYIRQCHGDLHLGNIAYIDDKICLFDAIEFNPKLSWIDVISELAFLTMDLQARGYPDHSAQLLSLYLQQTGDYSGIAFLRFYQLYRAMVRAKVTAISLSQSTDDAELSRRFHAYLEQADAYTRKHKTCLLISYGLSGSGKSHYCQKLAAEFQLIHLSSDIERKRLFGLSPLQNSTQLITEDIYSQQTTTRTYQRLLELAAQLLKNGFSVVVDATFLRRHHRQTFLALAQSLSIPYIIMHISDDLEVFRHRIQQRQQLADNPSEADISVMEQQFSSRDELSLEERDYAIALDSGNDLSWQEFRKQLTCLIK